MDHAVNTAIKGAERVRQATAQTSSASTMEREAARITAANMTPLERYEAKLHRLSSVYLSTSMTAQTYNREAQRLLDTMNKQQSQLDGTAAAQKKLNEQMRRGGQLMEQHASTVSRYYGALNELDDLLAVGAIGQTTYNQELQRQRAILNNTANPEYNKMLKEGEELTKKYADANVVHAERVIRLNELYKAGVIDVRTYKLAIQELDKALAAGTGRLQSLSTNLVFVGLNMTAMFGGLTAVIAGVLLNGAKLSAEFEKVSMAFRVMIGDVEAAKSTLQGLENFAIRTPFTFTEVVAAGRTMITFGEQGRQLMRTMEYLGNAAAATGTDFSMVALIFNQIRGVGKLLQQDFRQFSTRGILSLQDFVDAGIAPTTAAVQEMMSNGEISFNMVRDVLRSLSEDGGRFAGIMEAYMDTAAGKFAVFTGQLQIMMRTITDEISPEIKNVLDLGLGVIEWVNSATPTTKRWVAVLLLGTGALAALGLGLSTIVLLGGQLAFTYTTLTALAVELNITWAGSVATLGTLRAAMFATVTSAGFLTGALATLGVALIAYAGYQILIAPKVTETRIAIDQLTESAKRLNEQLSSSTDEGILKAAGLVDIDEQRAELENLLEFQNYLRKEQMKNLKGIQKEYAELGESWFGWFWTGEMQRLVQTQQESLNTIEDNIAKLQTELKSTSVEEQLRMITEEAAKLKKELEFDTATISMSEVEKKIYELDAVTKQYRFGSEELNTVLGVTNELRQKASELEEAKSIKEANDEVNKYIESLKKQSEILTLSFAHGDQANDMYEKTQMLLKAQTDEQRRLINSTYDQIQADEARKKNLEEIRELTKSMLRDIQTPIEKLEEKFSDLDRVWNQGFFSSISRDQYIQIAGKAIADFGAEVARASDPLKAYDEQLKILQGALKAGLIDQQEFGTLTQAIQDQLDKSNFKAKAEVSFEVNTAARRGSAEFNRLMTNLYYGQQNSRTTTGQLVGPNGTPVSTPNPTTPLAPIGTPNAGAITKDKTAEYLKIISGGIEDLVSYFESLDPNDMINLKPMGDS